MVHSCEPWTSLGINCPAGVLEALGVPGEGDDELVEENFDPVFALPGHRKAKAPPPAQAQVAEMMMLMNLWRGAVVRGAGGLTPQPAKIPVEIVREAYQQGARGRELGLWVAAGAASLAIGVRFGPSALQHVPRILLEGLRGRPGGKGGAPATAGGMGFKFNASRRLQTLLAGGSLRKLSGSVASGLLGGGGSSSHFQ